MEPWHMSGRKMRTLSGWLGVGVVAMGASLFASPAMAAVPPFGACPIEAYQTIQADDVTPDTYSLYTIDVGVGTVTNIGTDPDLQGNNAGNTNGINAIGFEETGRFIYGWNNSVHQVVRVGGDGSAEFIGPTPAGMGNVKAVVGDVYQNKLYLWSNKSGGTMYVVDLATNTLVNTLATTNVDSINDWAFNINDGMIYYVRNNDGAVVQVNPATGVGTDVPGVNVPTGAAFGAQYFDNQGSLYASRNDGNIFRVRNAAGGGTPSVELLTSAAPSTNQNDGARCPSSPPPVPSIAVQKQLTGESGSISGKAEAGENLTYTLTLTNSGAAPQTAAYSFFEVLPANTTLVSLGGATSDCTVGQSGSRLCTITVPGPIAANGGSASATLVAQVASPIPAGVTAISNLVTDDANTPPPGCSTSGQPCAPPPTCNAVADPKHCVVTPLPSADLQVTKTNGETALVPGQTTSYPIVVTNAGPDSATGAVVRDPAPTGLTCTTPATCTGAACPGATIPIATLQGAGATLGTMNVGDTATISMTCTVN